MKHLFCVPVIFLLFTSCAKQPEQGGRVDTTQMAQSFKVQPGPDIFISKKYPIEINLSQQKMLWGKESSEKISFGYQEDTIWIKARWDIGESSSLLKSDDYSVFTTIEISTSSEALFQMMRWVDISTAQIMIGNIPALPYDDDRSSFLLIPGLYARLRFISTCQGLDDERFPEDKDDPFWCAKVNAAQNFLIEDGIRWTEPIHTSSKQFLDWKAHILALIEEARRVEALTSEK
ncbi:MAG: hypothetical protein AABZ44_02205 [Elusimicrobiota bacterium]